MCGGRGRVVRRFVCGDEALFRFFARVEVIVAIVIVFESCSVVGGWELL